MSLRPPALVRRTAEPVPPPRWDDAARAVLAHTGGFLRVLGGPGTGKTTLLAEVAADRIRQGEDPEHVLVLAASRKSAITLRARITALLTADQPDGLRTIREPLVRTVHSYAFAVLRLQAARDGLPPPRLLSGPEQDTVVRELLAGDIETGALDWPERLRPALGLPGFAAELRDLLLRAAERGVGPEELIELGERHERPEWVAAGTFGLQYEQVTLLRGVVGSTGPQAAAPALDAAELVGSALLALQTDPDLLAAERARVRHLLVDDGQHLDPLQYTLIRRLGDAAQECLLFGDPDQAVFTFRGADPRRLLAEVPGERGTVVLTQEHRMAPAVRAAVSRLAGRLPGAGPQRELRGRTDGRSGSVQIRVLASAAQEATWIADQLRRAHLLEEVPWSRMAVLVRSTGNTLPVLRRALLAAGVPVAVPADELPLPQQNAVWPFLTVLRCAARPDLLDPDLAAALLTGPFGGGDPLALRKLRRGLRRLELAAGGDRASGELLVEALNIDEKLVALDEAAAPARRVAMLLRIAREAVAAGEGVEQVLWQVWQASGLEQRWLALAGRHGPVGAQADRDLDSVVALFDAAARYADRLPGSGVAGFADYLTGQQISGDTLAPAAPQGEAVAVLTAHAAVGREWTLVAIPGVQEGIWPDLRLRGSLLGVERLIDLLAGVRVEDKVSAVAPILAEERRLLLVAASRARQSLIVSAVRGEDDTPSRFLDELDGADFEGSDEADAIRPVFQPSRGLILADLVGDLRRAVCDPRAEPAQRERAATQLARLAAAGVPGAHPDSWYGLGATSTERPLWTDVEAVGISPSTVDILSRCPLRWMVERHGGQDPAELASITGSLVHALVQAASSGADPDALQRTLDEAWAAVDAGAPWFSRKERARVEGMVDSFRAWLVRSRAELTQVAVEHEITVELPPKEEGGPWLRVKGRVDRLDTDTEHRPVVVDIKTARTAVSKKEAEEHPQLAVYQLAAALGAFSSLGLGTQPGGARLLYVAKPDKKSGAAERNQAPLNEEGVKVWLDAVYAAGQACIGPTFVATENTDCSRCPARTCCPTQDSGRQVSE
ncbi:ATP-dependent helicase [Crossiella cryophila]|uniref:DNA 3'-5' helicase n=1 Tax=Crossiella cryophila TaxID=43355 RepID=A0A7W7C3N7_9PSEU|nr:ATP-dependent DNA helicase [Crossiella cryophila]MBB4673904.1 superfamily I DNA/RNA helicase/RecB family exonuclease [Crossiella cryophila]